MQFLFQLFSLSLLSSSTLSFFSNLLSERTLKDPWVCLAGREGQLDGFDGTLPIEGRCICSGRQSKQVLASSVTTILSISINIFYEVFIHINSIINIPPILPNIYMAEQSAKEEPKPTLQLSDPLKQKLTKIVRRLLENRRGSLKSAQSPKNIEKALLANSAEPKAEGETEICNVMPKFEKIQEKLRLTFQMAAENIMKRKQTEEDQDSTQYTACSDSSSVASQQNNITQKEAGLQCFSLKRKQRQMIFSGVVSVKKFKEGDPVDLIGTSMEYYQGINTNFEKQSKKTSHKKSRGKLALV